MLVCASLACQTLFPRPAPPTPLDATPTLHNHSLAEATPTSETFQIAGPTTLTPAATPIPNTTPPPLIAGVRACDYIPGISIPATMPAEVTISDAPTPFPLPPLPSNSEVNQDTTDRQLNVFQDLWDTVNTQYLYDDFNGHDWEAIGDQYRSLVEGGLTDEDFYYAMDLMLWELGDDHSDFQSPEEVITEEAAYAGENNFVGIGILVDPIPGTRHAVILYTFPDGPADEAGLRAHDVIVSIDGQSPLGADGSLDDQVLRGPEGSTMTILIDRPGAGTFDLTLTRARIVSPLPVDYCAVPGTRIGYIFIPGLDDQTVGDQVRTALEKFTADGPLDGLVLDNRLNYGGSDAVLEEILGFFIEGEVGEFVSQRRSRPLNIEAEAISNSQTTPLVILADVGTASFGEIMTGILQNQSRARVVGQTTLGNVETLWGYDFEDGSRAWIAHETFQPIDLPNGIWENTGIVPDVAAPTRWDLFTEATDPALATAVELLSTR